MNESVGNALLFNLVITFIIILLAFFIGSMSYSKASKVKNKIIEEIEKQGEYDEITSKVTGEEIYENAEEEINDWLSSSGIGYRVNTNPGQVNNSCPQSVNGDKLLNSNSTYEYCVYLHSTCTENNNRSKCGEYFTVITYMYFDIPVIQELIKIPIKGETMTFSQITS